MTAWRRFLHFCAGRLPTRVISAETALHDALQGTSALFERSHVFTLRLPFLGETTCYLHHYLRSDPDRGVHDHPWPWMLAIPLAGGYDEQRRVAFTPLGAPVTRIFRRRAFAPYRLTGHDHHRVILRAGVTSWSLFLTGPNVKGWGFLRAEPARDGVEWTHRGVYTPHVEPDGSHTSWWRTAPKGRFLRRAAP